MYNVQIQQFENIKIVGADVEELYPSLSDIEVALICFRAIMQSDIEFQNLKLRCLGMYFAMHITREEVNTSPLARVLPRRTAKGGARPGVRADPRNTEHWRFPSREMTKLEERTLVGMAV